MINEDNVIRAWNFASEKHGEQKNPGTTIPYINHLGSVLLECVFMMINNGSFEDAEQIMINAILHDVLEDTNTQYEEVVKHFGRKIAEEVLALTENNNFSAPEEKVLENMNRIKQQSKAIWKVKLSDRIANLQDPPEDYYDEENIKYYIKESALIKNILGESDKYLSSRLESKIVNYKRFLKNK